MTGDLKAVTFDCWGTLINDRDFAAATAIRVRAIAEASAGGMSPEDARELLDRAWREHHRHWLDGVQFGSPGIAKIIASELGDQAIFGLLQETFEDAGRHGAIYEIPGAAHTLATLRDQGIRTALVCDAGMTPGRVVRDLLDGVGVLEHLEFCAFSDEVGVPKPSPTMFETALSAIDVKADEAVHVGDLLRTDVDGARAFGMRTIRITAVTDDIRQGVSWDIGAVSSVSSLAKSQTALTPPFADADEVIASYEEFPAALARLASGKT
ncbi:MAG: HAD family hydrolase [Actinomycetota bacterium]